MIGNALEKDDLEDGVKRVGKSWDEEIGFVGEDDLDGSLGFEALIFQLVSKKNT